MMGSPNWVMQAVTGLCFLGLAICASRAVAEEGDARITANDLATLRDVDALSVSPDGRWAAFIARDPDPVANTYRQTWYVTSLSEGASRAIADGGEPLQHYSGGGRLGGFVDPHRAVWSPDSRWIFYLRKESGSVQIWRTRADGRRTERLTHNEGEVVDVLASEDGRQLFFETRLSQRQIEARLAEEARSGFLYNSRFYPTYSTQPLLPEVDGADAFTLWVYDFASRRERLATQEEQQEYQLVSARGPMSPAGAEARTEPFGEGGARHVTVRRPGAASAIVCAHPDCYAHDRRLGAQQLRGMWWRSEDELIFARGDRSTTTVYAWRVGAETVPRRILTTLDMVAPVAAYWKCSIGGDRLICFHEQANYPRRLVAIDLDSGSFQTLYDPNPNFARFDLGPPPQYLTIDVDSEVRTFGYLVLPPHRREGERLPLVIVTYRCNGFLRGGVGDEYPVFPFAAQGFAVLCYDIPTEDPLRLAQMGVEEFYNWSRGPGDPIKHRIQDGLNSAVEQLDSVGIIDPNRVGLTGLSYGGETAIFALFNMNHLATAIASGVEIGPSSTFLYSSGWERTARAWGLDRWDSPRWDTLSVTHNVDRVYAPLLLNIPDRELISALHPYVALQQGGRPVEMYVFPDEYHAKWQPAHRLAIYQRNIDWMNFWLRDVEDPDPAKATQYERWRALRAQRAALR